MYFSSDQRTRTCLSVEKANWDCFMKGGEKMEGPFVDLMLRHLVLRAPTEITDQYHVASQDIVGALVSHLHYETLSGCKGKWEWLGDVGYRWLLSGKREQNTVVVPYCDKEHWSLFILEKDRTLHLGQCLELHDHMWADDFATLLHIGWATARQLAPGSEAWWKMVSRVPAKWQAPHPNETWECGYHMCFLFWQYMCARGDAKGLSKKPKFALWTGPMMQLWFVEAVYRETVTSDSRYAKPYIVSKGDKDQYFTTGDIDVEFPESVVCVYTQERDWGLSAVLQRVRLLESFCIQPPPHPSVEQTPAREARLYNEKKVRADRRRKLQTLYKNLKTANQ